jgi:hypothetical protein
LSSPRKQDKPRAKEALADGVTALAELQDKLYAQDKWAVLLIFQAMDAAGKRWRDQTRYVWDEPPRLSGIFIQITIGPSATSGMIT